MTGIDSINSNDPFEWDVFISYAHADNNKLVDEPHGWVEQFEKDFQKTLGEQLGRAPRIWRDSDITPNEDFRKKIFLKLAKSVIFLPVLSKIFVRSDYCKLELQTFVENAEKKGATYIGPEGVKKRIFVVEKLPVDPLPAELQELGGRFEFHDSGDPLRPTLSAKDSPIRGIYITVLNRLSRTAASLIELAAAQKTPEAKPSSAQPVYLAETTSDLYEAREALRDELIDRGFRVLPELELPRDDVTKYAEKVKSSLADAVLSVHLIGRKYGFIPEGENELSNVWLQHRLALERSERDPPMSQVIWLANGSETPSDKDDARQRKLIDDLQNDEKVHAHAEVIVGDIETLKTDLLDKLQKIRTPDESEKPEHPRIYIICDKADRSSEQLTALRKHLYERGCETRLPTEDGTDDDALKAHQKKLRDFDAFIVYHGAGSESWLESQLDDFHTFLRNRPKKVLAKAVYLAPPKTSAKDEFETYEATVLRGDNSFMPESVASFLRLCGKAEHNRS